MASALEWVPDSLYNTTISSVVSRFNRINREIRLLPSNVQFDIYYKLYKHGKFCLLGLEFSELGVFSKVLYVTDKRLLLHHCFQALMDHGTGLSSVLADNYSQHCCMLHCASEKERSKAIRLGLSLGMFLSEAGWYVDADHTFVACLQLCKTLSGHKYLVKSLECYLRLLQVRNCYCKFNEADMVFNKAQNLSQMLASMQSDSIEEEESCRTTDSTPTDVTKINFAGLYNIFSCLYFSRSSFDQAYMYSIKALEELDESLPSKMIIDVMRQACKACVAKRQFKRAELLIKHSVKLARDKFGPKHPKTADALADYGFYLLNVDSIRQSVQVYQAALNIRQSVFSGCNLLLAVTHEDLAYASYVNEYSVGIFNDAKEHAEKSMDIMKQLLPDNHLLLASSKRVKALILEEIAIESDNKEHGQKLLEDALELHISALKLTQQAFGELNVQTAKHYGNLGRLYQSMKKYDDARDMHLTAIRIKEKLLGGEDYEVALSVGHLASLYAYDMHLYAEAEQLYLRSIDIGKKLFGNSYSGLEYDYRGLLKVYNALENHDKVVEYLHILENWKRLRIEKDEIVTSPLSYDTLDLTTAQVIDKFFNMD